MQHASQKFTFEFLYIPRASVAKKYKKKKWKGLAGGGQSFTTSPFICGCKNINANKMLISTRTKAGRQVPSPRGCMKYQGTYRKAHVWLPRPAGTPTPGRSPTRTQAAGGQAGPRPRGAGTALRAPRTFTAPAAEAQPRPGKFRSPGSRLAK